MPRNTYISFYEHYEELWKILRRTFSQTAALESKMSYLKLLHETIDLYKLLENLDIPTLKHFTV